MTLRLGRNDFFVGQNDSELGRNDFELGRNNLGLNRLEAKQPVSIESNLTQSTDKI